MMSRDRKTRPAMVSGWFIYDLRLTIYDWRILAKQANRKTLHQFRTMHRFVEKRRHASPVLACIPVTVTVAAAIQIVTCREIFRTNIEYSTPNL
jgi:hypothetical protein